MKWLSSQINYQSNLSHHWPTSLSHCLSRTLLLLPTSPMQHFSKCLPQKSEREFKIRCEREGEREREREPNWQAQVNLNCLYNAGGDWDWPAIANGSSFLRHCEGIPACVVWPTLRSRQFLQKGGREPERKERESEWEADSERERERIITVLTNECNKVD